MPPPSQLPKRPQPSRLRRNRLRPKAKAATPAANDQAKTDPLNQKDKCMTQALADMRRDYTRGRFQPRPRPRMSRLPCFTSGLPMR